MNKDVLDSMLYGLHASNEVRYHVTAYTAELRGVSKSVQLEVAIYEVARVRALADRLRAALEVYADTKSWRRVDKEGRWEDWWLYGEDGYARARKALEGGE